MSASAMEKSERDLNLSKAELKDGLRNVISGPRVTSGAKVTGIDRTNGKELIRRSKKQLEQQIAARLAAERKLLQSQESLRAVSGRLLAIQDEERRHLGRELHDSVGQYWVALKMHLDSLKRDAAAMGVRVVQRTLICFPRLIATDSCRAS